MHRFLFILAFLATSQSVQAETIYRCKTPKGVVSLQSSPCAETDKQLTSVDKSAAANVATPTPTTPIASVPAVTPASAVTPDNSGGTASTVVASNNAAQPSGDTQGQRCSSAKSQREAVLRQSKKAPSTQLQRQLDAEIKAACAGL